MMSAYREVTGDDSRPISIGGGTYAKAMPNMVVFGPNFPAVFFFKKTGGNSRLLVSGMKARSLYMYKENALNTCNALNL